MAKKSAIWVLFFAASAASAATEERTITAFGSCERQVASDRGSIDLTAEFLEADVKSAAQKATASYEKVREAVQKLGLDKLEVVTTEYSLQEAREWEKNKSVSKGYRARMGLRVKTASIARLGEVITVAAREGLRDVGALSTFLSPEKEREARADCLAEAARDARAKAERMAQAVGSKVGPAVLLREVNHDQGYQPPMPVVREMKAMAMSDAPPPPTVEGGKDTVRATVEAGFRLL